jgi:hypothetical protein
VAPAEPVAEASPAPQREETRRDERPREDRRAERREDTPREDRRDRRDDRRDRRDDRREDRREARVVGMGDHVPEFILRSFKIAAPAVVEADEEEVAATGTEG